MTSWHVASDWLSPVKWPLDRLHHDSFRLVRWLCQVMWHPEDMKLAHAAYLISFVLRTGISARWSPDTRRNRISEQACRWVRCEGWLVWGIWWVNVCGVNTFCYHQSFVVQCLWNKPHSTTANPVCLCYCFWHTVVTGFSGEWRLLTDCSRPPSL